MVHLNSHLLSANYGIDFRGMACSSQLILEQMCSDAPNAPRKELQTAQAMTANLAWSSHAGLLDHEKDIGLPVVLRRKEGGDMDAEHYNEIYKNLRIATSNAWRVASSHFSQFCLRIAPKMCVSKMQNPGHPKSVCR